MDIVQLLHWHVLMSWIRSFDACQINLYPKDHLPPHSHVVASDGREWLVRIDNGEILDGLFGRHWNGPPFRRTGSC